MIQSCTLLYSLSVTYLLYHYLYKPLLSAPYNGAYARRAFLIAHLISIINGKAPSGGSGGVTDKDLSNIAVNFFGKGVAKPDDYKLEQQSTPNMTVKVNTGKCYVPNSTGTMLYQTELDASVNATIGNNASGNPRIDAVVIKVDTATTPNATASNVATIVVVAGTPAASPSAPNDAAIQSAVGAGNAFYRLGNVTVANGAVSITNANIASTREGVVLRIVGGYLKYNLATSRLQFSNDGTTFKDVSQGIKAYQVATAPQQNTTSGSFVDFSGGTVAVVVDVASNVFVDAHCMARGASGSVYAYLKVTYDSGGADTDVGNLAYTKETGDEQSLAAGGLVLNLAPGTYTFAMMKKSGSGGTQVDYWDANMAILVMPA